MTQDTLPNGVAIVTGATGGMGAASAVRLAGAGWQLILTDLDEARLQAVAAPLRASGTDVSIVAGSITDGAFPAKLLAGLGERSLGALVHAAGVSPTMGDAELMFSVNFDATARLVQAILPHIVEGGCAVLIASSSGYAAMSPELDAAIDKIGLGEDSSTLRALAGSAGHAYSIAKRGVQRIAMSQAPAFGARNARIVSISPGLIDTAMTRAEAKESPQMAEMLRVTPLGRHGTADEIASVAVFLCSPDASFITGSDIKVDGGVLAVL